jgi:lactate dehydrogenase-like 2-hydroxyacid dehydrogenase
MGLDVCENELHVPLEIFAMDIIVLSNHRAVGTFESICAMLGLIASNLADYNLTYYNIMDFKRKRCCNLCIGYIETRC